MGDEDSDGGRNGEKNDERNDRRNREIITELNRENNIRLVKNEKLIQQIREENKKTMKIKILLPKTTYKNNLERSHKKL